MVWESLGAFWQSPSGRLYLYFTEEWLPSAPLTIKAWLVECWRDGRIFQTDNHLYRGTPVRCQSDHLVLGNLSDQCPSPLIAQFCWAASSKKSLGGSKRLPFKNGGHCVLVDLQWCNHFLGTLPQICASTQSCLWALRTIPSTSGLRFCSDMHCQQWDLRQVYAFPNHVQSIEFTTGGLQSSCTNINDN